MDETWFSGVEPVHAIRGRVRFRYRRRPSMPAEGRRICSAVASIEGVESVRVNERIDSLVIRFEPEVTDLSRLREGILSLTAPPLSRNAGRSRNDEASLLAVGFGGVTLMLTRWLPPWLQLPLSIAIALPVLGAAVRDLFRQGITSHVLEALAVIISIARRDYFAANTTAFLLALGEYLEHSIQRRSDDLLKHLMRPGDTEVWVERDGEELLVDARQVRTGDTVIAATGTVIPVDGTVLGGEALVNESTMTGESVPVTRRRGDTALSGTLVQEGRIRIYAERVGRHAAAARIADFVEHSLEAKSNTQLEAARLADRLVPMVLGLSGGTWVVSQDTERVAAVLQADYSCALKLATPVAFKSAMYRAGQSGMLVKGATALEKLAEADTFVFDKTGTLSSGQLQVTDSIAFDSQYTSEDLINMAASVEEHYFHPMAMALVEAAERLPHQQHFNHKEVEFIVAHGVASSIEGRRIVVGSRHFLEEHEGIDMEPFSAVIERLRNDGKTLLYIGYGGELLGVLALKDTLRSNAAATVQRLRQLGVGRVIMLTGDQPERARLMAEHLGLDDYRAGLMPEDKALALKNLAGEGARIAFVGDGINDAPALSGAHVGMAMHHGADVARLAADITLLEDDIARVADAKALALATRGLVDSNFKLTVGLNTGILSAAAFGLLNPVAASALHNGSTIGILLRALAGAGLSRGQAARAA
ncbi:heavy metal translocating P-type ATPase [Ectothiorhodospira variabilis]|uniref:heavy metal translocating P-type ATPase n=1 Tax=Ectothiorhodospira variabilis TaxID=505694 RepID=UPI001EFA3B13|nr:heavy metal translocating P-type ATPase [Ectothiorhodospira variabilis]MCG5493981.1 heavy metal translocating P-type ATPase [Ectothiorhodospira variabilis]MCG5503784.1 heavy metal translocating P-type ATPase [Ectothiorhodospira variabilis]MCG5506939.1 heavy metal translocating P-type ATPase [Ectothiorhodospira variabilis]